MPKSINFICWSVLILNFAKPTAYANPMEASFSKIKKNGTEVSVLIQNLRTGKILAKVDDGKVLNPASSIKLFTAYAALHRLGFDFEFKTKVHVGPDHKICVTGGGDPSFVMEDLYLLVQGLKRKGVDRIKLPLTLDATVFDNELIPEDRTDQDSERAYNAPMSGLNFNYNTITVFVNPTEKGKPARVSLDWPFPFVQMKGQVMTGGATNVTWDKAALPKSNQEVVHIGGKINDNGPEWRKPFRINRPATAFGLAFLKMLSDFNVESAQNFQESDIREGTCLGDPLYTHASQPLPDVVKLMNKYSNNFIADSLVKMLDHEVNHVPGSSVGGIKYIRDLLTQIGIASDKNGRKLVSGSGLTRGNYFSASDFMKLLTQIEKDHKLQPELYASFPLAGLDGTLKKKYVGSNVSGLLRGKTGTLNGVQSLVGVYPSQGDWIGVAILLNGNHGIPEQDLSKFLSDL